MEVKKIVEGMTATQVAQVIDENFNALNGEKATVEAVADVQKNVNRSDDNTGVLYYPEYSSTEPVAVGDVRRYEGLLYRAKEAGAYDWDPEKWERVTLKQLEDEKLSELGSKVDINKFLLNIDEKQPITPTGTGYIKTNVNIGEKVDLNPYSTASTWRYYVLPVSVSYKIVLTGKGSENAKLWAFLDNEDKLLSIYESSTTLVDAELDVPEKAVKILINTYIETIEGKVLYQRKSILEDDIKNIGSVFNVSYSHGYITTGDVGVLVSSFSRSSGTSYVSAIIPVNEGDTYYIEGKGGGEARLWAFLDEGNLVLKSSTKTYTSKGEQIVAPEATKWLIVNFANPEANIDNPPYKLYKITRYDRTIDKVYESLSSEIKTIKAVVLEPIDKGYILTNVEIGSYVDLTPDSTSSNWKYYISDVHEGQVLRLEECRGGGNSRLWAFLDKDSNLLSISGSTETVLTCLELEVPSGAKKVVINNSIEHMPNAKFTLYDKDSLEIRIENLEKKEDSYSNQTTNILVFGNSYSYRSIAQGGGNILNLARTLNADIFIQVIGNAGGSFESNYNKHIRGEKNAYRWEGDISTGVMDKASEPLTFTEALMFKEWDYIIFHQASKHSGNIESFSPYLENLINVAKTYCNNENVKIGLMQTWAYADITLEDTTEPMFPTTNTTIPVFSTQKEMFDAICETYKQAIEKYEDISFLVPVGTAVQNARATDLGSTYNDFASGVNDGSHINSQGTLITSLVVFNKVFAEKHNIKLSMVSNDYSTLYSDEEFATAVNCARNAIKFPFLVK